MRVLYVNHTAGVSGAERSLLELMEGVRAHADVLLACPEGDLRRRAVAMGITSLEIESLRIGFGSQLRELPRAAARLVRVGLRVRKIARRHDVDVVHAASSRAGLVVAFSCLGGRGRVVDVRDSLHGSPRAALVRWLLRLSADALVFNSSFTRDRFGPTRPARATVAYPPVDIGRFLHLPLRSEDPNGRPPVLGVVGQITPWKGQDDAIRVLALLRKRIPETQLRIVGSVVFSGHAVSFDNEAFGRQLAELAAELEVADAVEFTGATDDLESVFASMDVLLVPSWEEPFGRVVAEAMAAGVPVVATNRGGPGELISDGVTGYLAEPRRPDVWVELSSRLLTDAHLRMRISEEARRHVVSVIDRQGLVERAVRLYEETAVRSRGLKGVVRRAGVSVNASTDHGQVGHG